MWCGSYSTVSQFMFSSRHQRSTIKNTMLILYIIIYCIVFLWYILFTKVYIAKRDVQIALCKMRYLLYLFYIVHGESIDGVTNNTLTRLHYCRWPDIGNSIRFIYRRSSLTKALRLIVVWLLTMTTLPSHGLADDLTAMRHFHANA